MCMYRCMYGGITVDGFVLIRTSCQHIRLTAYAPLYSSTHTHIYIVLHTFIHISKLLHRLPLLACSGDSEAPLAYLTKLEDNLRACRCKMKGEKIIIIIIIIIWGWHKSIRSRRKTTWKRGIEYGQKCMNLQESSAQIWTDIHTYASEKISVRVRKPKKS